MKRVAISGSGLFTPAESISNDELVVSFNAYVDAENARNADAIKAGTVAPLQHSSTEFIVKASGIKARYVVDKAGILDPGFMRPRIRARGDDEPALMVEMGMSAAREALERSNRKPDEIDLVIV